MPRHATGLGGGSFPVANKMLSRYEQDRQYRIHQQKLANMKCTIDVHPPKKRNHLLLRLKQIQKEEERQAEIDHENKLLLNKMTHTMKYGGRIDNWNNYESKSLNYPQRERVNEDIARENLGIARRLENIRPKIDLDTFERDYQKHVYLSHLWSSSVKDFGEYSPRRSSRMSRSVKRSLGSETDTYDDDFESDSGDRKKLPKLDNRRRHKSKDRGAKSESGVPVRRRDDRDQSQGTRLPKIQQKHNGRKHRIPILSRPQKDSRHSIRLLNRVLPNQLNETSHLVNDEQNNDRQKRSMDKDKIIPEQQETGDKSNVSDHEEKDRLNVNDAAQKSRTSFQTVHVAGNDIENVETLVSESKADGGDKDNCDIGDDIHQVHNETSNCATENASTSNDSEAANATSNDGMSDIHGNEVGKHDDSANNQVDDEHNDIKHDIGNKKDSNELGSKKVSDEHNQVKLDTGSKKVSDEHNQVKLDTGSKKVTDEYNQVKLDTGNKKVSEHNTMELDTGNKKVEDEDDEVGHDLDSKASTNKDNSNETVNKKTHNSLNDQDKQTAEAKDQAKRKPKQSVQHNNENNSSDDGLTTDEDVDGPIYFYGQKKTLNKVNKGTDFSFVKKDRDINHEFMPHSKKADNKTLKDEQAHQKPSEDTSDVAQLFKISKQLGRPEDVFIKTLVKKSHKQRIAVKAKFRQKYDLDLVSELKEGLGSDWEHLIEAALQQRDVAAAYAVFDALSTLDMSDVVEILAMKDNAAMAELKEAYRKEFSISLEEDLSDRSTPPLQTLITMLQKGNRDESSKEVDNQEAFNDALALHESGEGRWTSDGGNFLRLISERSIPHVQAVLMEYKTASGGTDILSVMKEECPDEYYITAQTLINITRSPPAYYADIMHKHKSPTDPLFISLLVTRSEIDMPQIKKAYKSKYGTDLVDHIRSKPHATMRCLVEFANKVPQGLKAKDTKKLTGGLVQTQPQQKGGQLQTMPQQHVRNPAIKPIKSKGDGVDVESPLRKSDAFKSKSQRQTGPQQAKSKGDKGANEAAKAKALLEKEREKSMDDGNHNGTVNPVNPFRPDDDVQKLNNAMSGLGTDEAMIISVIPKRSNRQRQALKQRYEQTYRKNLMIDLESELNGDMEEIVLALMMSFAEYDAYCLHEAVEGLGTSEATLIGIICTRSAKEISRIRECYLKAYKTDMQQDISQDSTGTFRDLVLALMKGEREPGAAVNMEEAHDDAEALYKDGEVAIDPSMETFQAILTQKTHMQVKATFDEYKRLTDHDVYTAIRNFMTGDDEEGYVGLAKAIEDPIQFYAERLNSCFTHIGVNDNMLIRIIVSRSEVDLMDIKARYVELYGKSLPEVVNRECKGDYKKMLIAVLDNEDELGRVSRSPSKKNSKKGKSGMTNIGAA